MPAPFPKGTALQWGYYFGARYYPDRDALRRDPVIGRWMAVDPMADKYPSLSPYVYCANIPMIYIDPDGRDLKGAIKHAIGAYSYYQEAQGGAALIGSAGPVGWIVGGGQVTHGSLSAVLEILNVANELSETILGEKTMEYIPQGLNEAIASLVTDNQLTINTWAISDIGLNLTSAGAPTRLGQLILSGKGVKLAKMVKLLYDYISKTKSGVDTKNILEELQQLVEELNQDNVSNSDDEQEEQEDEQEDDDEN